MQSSDITRSLSLSRLAPDIRTLYTPLSLRRPREILVSQLQHGRQDFLTYSILWCPHFHYARREAPVPANANTNPNTAISYRNLVSLPRSPVMKSQSHRRIYMTSCSGIYLWVLAIGLVVVTAPVSAHTEHSSHHYSTYSSQHTQHIIPVYNTCPSKYSKYQRISVFCMHCL